MATYIVICDQDSGDNKVFDNKREAIDYVNLHRRLTNHSVHYHLKNLQFFYNLINYFSSTNK